ncbi:MAG: hypothetical protein FWD40_03060 [Treponema sp.]|nr:hypothetical protein [Treponema sp.]
MSKEKIVAITLCGNKKSLDRFSIKVFVNDESDNDAIEKADDYCSAVNNLELKGDTWAFARIVQEDRSYSIRDLIPFRFDNFFDLDDRSIQRVLREVDSTVLAKALKDVCETSREKIFKNVSKRAAAMIREDMDYMGPVRKSDVIDAQEKIIDIIRYLSDTGDIVISFDNSEVVL